MALSEYSRETITDYVRGTNFPAAPSALYATLSTADPTPSGSGLAEPGGITRQTVTLSSPVSSNNDGVVTANVDPIVFTGVIGTITHVAVFDAASGGNLLYYAPMSVIRVVTGGDSVSFASGTFKLTLKEMIGSGLGEAYINWMRNGTYLAAPAVLKLALSTTAPNRDGTNISRPGTSNGYTDKDITLLTGTPDINDGIPLYNSTDIVFGPATTTSWPQVTHAALIRDDNNAIMFYGETSNPLTTLIGNGIAIVTAAFTVRVK